VAFSAGLELIEFFILNNSIIIIVVLLVVTDSCYCTVGVKFLLKMFNLAVYL